MSATLLSITAWSALSPFGIGRAAFADGIAAGASTLVDVGPDVPDQRAGLVPGFDVVELLGKKGTRSMDRVTGLAVTTVGRVLDEVDRGRPIGPRETVGLVLGTTTGSAQSMMDFTRDSLTGAMPFFVDPARFPNTVMNCAAGQSAIWHGLSGPNATVAGGRTAGLHALNYARRLLASGRATSVCCGAVEEYSPARSWLEWHARGRQHSEVALGEGCVVFLVEPGESAQSSLAELLAVEFGSVTDDVRPALAACVRRALDRASVSGDEIVTVATCGAPGTAGRQERAAVTDVVGERAVESVSPAALMGDTGAAATCFQVAAVLAQADRRGWAGGVALVTAQERGGVVGCALLRLH